MRAQQYIGVKLVEAERTDGTAGPGYRVRYPGGYESWCPANVFEAAYLPVSGDGIIGFEEVTDFANPDQIKTSKIGKKTAVVQVTCRTGFEITETSACVHPEDFSQEDGTRLAIGTIQGKLRDYLAFVLQWAMNGLDEARNDDSPLEIIQGGREVSQKQKDV